MMGCIVIALGIMGHAVITNILSWYATLEYNRRGAIVKRGYFEYEGVRYKLVG